MLPEVKQQPTKEADHHSYSIPFLHIQNQQDVPVRSQEWIKTKLRNALLQNYQQLHYHRKQNPPPELLLRELEEFLENAITDNLCKD